MKKPLLFLALAFSGLATSAQTNLAPGSSGAEVWGQMLNTSNLYYTSATVQSISTPPLGLQKDTTAGTLRLCVSTVRTQKITGKDSVLPQPINGNGKISFSVYVWHASTTSSVTPKVVLTLKKSINDLAQGQYIPVSGASVYTVNPTQAANTYTATPVFATWDLSDKQGRFFQVQADVTSDTAIITSSWYMQASNIYTK